MTEHTGCSGLVWWQGLITLGPETPRPKAAAERLARLRLLLLGPMTARDGRGRGRAAARPKDPGRACCSRPGLPATGLREELTGLFWSGRGRAQARASLRQCVHELQDMLLPIGEDVLRTDRTHLVLSNEGLWVDVHAMATGGSASELLRGTLLQDLVGLDPAFDRWLATERRKVATLARSSADQVLVGTAGPEAAIAAASRLVALDPGDEETWRILISLHMAQGDQELAELAYNRCGAALAACTGVAPSNETRALLEVSDGLPAAAAGPATAPASPPAASIRVFASE